MSLHQQSSDDTAMSADAYASAMLIVGGGIAGLALAGALRKQRRRPRDRRAQRPIAASNAGIANGEGFAPQRRRGGSHGQVDPPSSVDAVI